MLRRSYEKERSGTVFSPFTLDQVFADIVLARVIGSTTAARASLMDPPSVKIGAALLTLRPPIGTPPREKRLEV